MLMGNADKVQHRQALFEITDLILSEYTGWVEGIEKEQDLFKNL